MKKENKAKVNKTRISVSLILLAFTFWGMVFKEVGIETSSAYTPNIRKYSNDTLIVQFNEELSESKIRTINNIAQVTEEDEIKELRTKVIKVPKGSTVEEMLSIYGKNPNIDMVQPNYEMQFLDTIPTDPNYKSQAPVLSVLNLQKAWDYTTGSKDVIIAVVDSGVYDKHPDLQGRILPGYAAVAGLAYNTDKLGHGSGVAGTIAQIGNNGIGGVGVMMGDVRILPVKIDDANGSISVSNVAKGIIWATDNGARIINLSLGYASDSTTLKSAIDYAYSKGVLITAASGNESKSVICYPARYDNVIGVGSTTNGTSKVASSNYGIGLNLIAFGGWYTVNTAGGYINLSGTSFSTPQVAGLAGLLLSMDKTLTNKQLQYYIEAGATPLGGQTGWNNQTGYGLMNAYNSLKLLAIDKGLEPGVTPPPSTTITITNTTLPSGTSGSSYSNTMNVSGGVSPYTWSASGLPSGLTINSNTGVIAGTPSTSGTYTVNVTVKDSKGVSGSKSLTLSIGQAIPALSINTNALPSGTQGSLYSAGLLGSGGVSPYTWSVTGLPSGLTINSSTGTIGGTPSTSGTFNVSITLKDSSGKSISKTFSISIAGQAMYIVNNSIPEGEVNKSYSTTLGVSGGKSKYTWSATGLPSGLKISSDGKISGTPSVAGNYNVTVTVTDANKTKASKTIVITIKAGPLSISTNSLANGTINTSYTSTVSGSGGTKSYTWSASGLPSGLTMSTAGVISGKPTVVGSYNVNITLRDTGGSSVSKTISIKINTLPLTIVTSTLPSGEVNKNYTYQVIIEGGASPYTYSGSGLPSGLSINSTTGVISGTPSKSGSSSATITVKDSSGTSSNKKLTISIGGAASNPSTPTTPALKITNSSFPDGKNGSQYNQQVNVSGGVGPYTYSASGLPSGLSINSTSGIISGNPAKVNGNQNFTITVKDAKGTSVSGSYKMKIG